MNELAAPYPDAAGPGDAPSTRQRILTVSAHHLARLGYRGLSLHQVVRELGVSAPAVYHHFPGGKEELVVAALLQRLEEVHRDMWEHIGTAGPAAVDRLAAAAHCLVTRTGWRPADIDDVVRNVDASHHPDLTRALHRAVRAPVSEVLKQAVHDGERPRMSTEAAADAFVSAIVGVAETRQRLLAEPGETAYSSDLIITALWAGISARALDTGTGENGCAAGPPGGGHSTPGPSAPGAAPCGHGGC